MGVDVETAKDGTTSRRMSAYLSSAVEITLVDDGHEHFLDARYTVDGGGQTSAGDRALAYLTFDDGEVVKLTAIAPPYASLDTHSATGALLETTYRARFPLPSTIAGRVTSTPIRAMRLGTPERMWSFETKPGWANELVAKSRCVIPGSTPVQSASR